MHRTAAIALVSIPVLFLVGCTRPEVPPEPVRAVRTLTVQAGSASSSHDYAADIRARVESRLSFRVGGKLLERRVQVGDIVKRGQVLARLDAQDLRLGQDAANAAVQAAEVNAQQAAADHKRFKNLFDQGFVSSAELERRETSLKSARAQAAQARAQLGVQGNQAAYSSLAADSAGVVTAVEAEPGMVVAAGSTVVRLALDGPRDAVFAVPEDQIGTMRALQGKADVLQVRLWGGTAAPALATVRGVAAAADPATRTFLVRADLGRTPVALGQTASVTVASPALQGVIKLPLTAVMQQQGRSAVWLVDATTMTVKVQPIEVAGADANDVVVAIGLVPGQVVVTADVHALTPGQKVRFYGAVPAAPSAPAAATASAR